MFSCLQGFLPRWRDVYLSSSISRGCPKTQIVPAITPEIARIARRIAHQCAYEREERNFKLYKENFIILINSFIILR